MAPDHENYEENLTIGKIFLTKSKHGIFLAKEGEGMLLNAKDKAELEAIIEKFYNEKF